VKRARPAAGDFIHEAHDYGLVIASGPVTYDVVWIGGSTTRYRHGERDVAIVHQDHEDLGVWRYHLEREAKAAREERREGRGIRRGQVSPR
jgi:hypothetical protein